MAVFVFRPIATINVNDTYTIAVKWASESRIADAVGRKYSPIRFDSRMPTTQYDMSHLSDDEVITRFYTSLDIGDKTAARLEMANRGI